MSLSQRSMFTQPQSVSDELKSILIDVRLLQRTCEMVSYDEMRPRKFSHLSFEEAQKLQKSLFPRMRELSGKLSDEEFKKVADEADKEAAILNEVTAGAFIFSK